jgi:hypothetical protein
VGVHQCHLRTNGSWGGCTALWLASTDVVEIEHDIERVEAV